MRSNVKNDEDSWFGGRLCCTCSFGTLLLSCWRDRALKSMFWVTFCLFLVSLEETGSAYR